MSERKKVDAGQLHGEIRRRAAINAKVFRVLDKVGDDSTTLREVAHWAYFANESAQSEFAEAVRQLGYSVTHTVPFSSSEEMPFGVEFSRVESVRPAILNAVCAELALLASNLGGEYDGWETQVI